MDTSSAFRNWIQACDRRSSTHLQYADFYDAILALVSLPTIAAPICAGNFPGLSEGWTAVLNLTGALGSAILVFNNFGAKASQHREYSNRYSLLAKEIQLETIRRSKDDNMVLQICLEKWFALELVAPYVHDHVQM